MKAVGSELGSCQGFVPAHMLVGAQYLSEHRYGTVPGRGLGGCRLVLEEVSAVLPNLGDDIPVKTERRYSPNEEVSSHSVPVRTTTKSIYCRNPSIELSKSKHCAWPSIRSS